MKELIARLFSKPGVAFELITASFFINALAMASPNISRGKNYGAE
jgi:hypothetical protein